MSCEAETHKPLSKIYLLEATLLLVFSGSTLYAKIYLEKSYYYKITIYGERIGKLFAYLFLLLGSMHCFILIVFCYFVLVQWFN